MHSTSSVQFSAFWLTQWAQIWIESGRLAEILLASTRPKLQHTRRIRRQTHTRTHQYIILVGLRDFWKSRNKVHFITIISTYTSREYIHAEWGGKCASKKKLNIWMLRAAWVWFLGCAQDLAACCYWYCRDWKWGGGGGRWRVIFLYTESVVNLEQIFPIFSPLNRRRGGCVSSHVKSCKRTKSLALVLWSVNAHRSTREGFEQIIIYIIYPKISVPLLYNGK